MFTSIHVHWHKVAFGSVSCCVQILFHCHRYLIWRKRQWCGCGNFTRRSEVNILKQNTREFHEIKPEIGMFEKKYKMSFSWQPEWWCVGSQLLERRIEKSIVTICLPVGSQIYWHLSGMKSSDRAKDPLCLAAQIGHADLIIMIMLIPSCHVKS